MPLSEIGGGRRVALRLQERHSVFDCCGRLLILGILLSCYLVCILSFYGSIVQTTFKLYLLSI